MATARLRKTFKYPDDDDVPANMDEQEQEKLIKELRRQNDEQNFDHLRLLVAVAATSAAFFGPIFFRTRLRKPKLLAVMGVTSILTTIYILVLVPNKGRKIPSKGVKIIRHAEVELTPVQRYLPYLNVALAAIVALMGLEFKDSPRVHNAYWAVCFIPIFIFSVIQLARKFLIEVDLDELEAMRYEYKGA